MPYVRTITPVDRFWTKVEKTEDCWLWTGALNKWGYGKYFVSHRQCVAAHRYAYMLVHGNIPGGRLNPLDHLCRTRRCVNPSHLERVTPRTNVLRGVGPAAVNFQKTHCIRGHEFTPENTYKNPSHPRSRFCYTCKRMASVADEQRRRERKAGLA